MASCMIGKRCRDKDNKITTANGGRKDTSSSRNGSSSPVQPDPFINSKKVIGLGCNNFNYLKSKDIALVMYYENDDKQCIWTKEHFKKAAESTKGSNHVYAAVNCSNDPDFCVERDVPSVPHFQLLSKSEPLPYFSVNPTEFFHEDMKMWVETHSSPK